jgi:hypothetical protein
MTDLNHLLIRSFDEELSPEEAQQLAVALATSEELRSKKDELLEMRSALSEWSPAPNPDFLAGVMSGLPVRLETMVVRLFPRVAAASLLLMGVMIAYLYFTDGSFLFSDYAIGIDTSDAAYVYGLLD